MKTTELGASSLPTVVLLHGAFFPDCFAKQAPLAEQFHMVIPHIMGFGKAADETFETEAALTQIKELIFRLNPPVYLVGFSLGAQLGFRLLADAPMLFRRAVLVSPWLLKKDQIPEKVMRGNLKMLAQLKQPFVCGLIGRANGMAKQARVELVHSMQLVSEQTVRNCVDNGICFESAPRYAECRVPTLALAGKREAAVIQDSVRCMEERNPLCTFQLWERARHNIPQMFANRFNQTLRGFFGEE